jgi:L-ribulose-5-phosphate 3-epimerase
MGVSRRRFLEHTMAVGGAAAIAGPSQAFDIKKAPAPEDSKLPFSISLAQWSFHKALFAKKMDHLDFAKVAKEKCGIDAVEYVNQFFKDKAKDEKYLGEMKKRADDLGVKSLLIMCDGEGDLGDPDEALRMKAVENHHKWVDAAKFLGCHSIRVNAKSAGSFEEQQKLAAEGLRKLTEYGDKNEINVIVENHGGLSSNGKWLAGVMKLVDHRRCGTLPDFGNFRIKDGEEYDRYQGVEELMPFAKGVSAKSHDFNDAGDEIHTDYRRMMKIVLKAGYKGYVGIEYEGDKTPELEGVIATRKLLEKVRDELK